MPDEQEFSDSPKTLEESDALYRSLVESLTDYALLSLDLDGKVTTWNAGAECLLGYRREEIVGQPGALIFTPEDREAGVPERELREAAATGRTENNRWQLRRDGERIWVNGVAHDLKNGAGELSGFVKVMRDETGRKQAEAALRDSEARWRSAFAIQTVGVMFWSEGFSLTDMNGAFLRMTGFTREEALGKTWAELTPPEFHPASLKAVEEVTTWGENTPYEKQHFRKDGSRWWGLFAACKVGNDIVEFVIDITEHKGVESALQALNETLERRVEEQTEKLRRSEQRFSQAFHAGPVAACITTVDEDRFLEVNASFLQVTGYTREEVIGQTNRELGMWSSLEDQARVRDTSGVQQPYRELELKVHTKEGDVRTVLGSGVRVGADRSTVMLKLFYDITDRRRTEEQLMAAIQEVMADTSWFSQKVMQQLANLRLSRTPTAETVNLSRREREVLERIARGLGNDAIAAELGLAPQTVRNYISTLYEKLGVHSRAEAVVWARERGIIGS